MEFGDNLIELLLNSVVLGLELLLSNTLSKKSGYLLLVKPLLFHLFFLNFLLQFVYIGSSSRSGCLELLLFLGEELGMSIHFRLHLFFECCDALLILLQLLLSHGIL